MCKRAACLRPPQQNQQSLILASRQMHGTSCQALSSLLKSLLLEMYAPCQCATVQWGSFLDCMLWLSAWLKPKGMTQQGFKTCHFLQTRKAPRLISDQHHPGCTRI